MYVRCSPIQFDKLLRVRVEMEERVCAGANRRPDRTRPRIRGRVIHPATDCYKIRLQTFSL